MQKMEFRGTVGELFKILLVGGLLTTITFGIYGFWLMADLIKFYQNNSTLRGADGRTYQLRCEITGVDVFKALFVGSILLAITFGIYAPWFAMRVQRLVAERTKIMENGRPAGTMTFVGQAGELVVAMIVGGLLTFITFGIYAAWYQVNLFKYFAKNTELKIGNETHTGEFAGTGGDFFVINLVGAILTTITFGIYSFWFMLKLMKFQAEHTMYGTKGMTLEDARKVQESAQPMMPVDDVSAKINEAARLMTSRRFQECIRAYDQIAADHPSERGTCESQIGAAYYFLGQYDTAILHYELAKKFGADRAMMDSNIVEARGALQQQRSQPRA